MKLDELTFVKNAYPRHRDKEDPGEIKWDADNVEKIKYVLITKGKIDHKITYNKQICKCHGKHHILDGNHLFQAMRELEWKEVPKEYLKEVEVFDAKELWFAAEINYKQGLTLTKNELKYVLKDYWEKAERLKYGTLKEFGADFGIPYRTLQQWIHDFETESAEHAKPHSLNREKLEEQDKTIQDLTKESEKKDEKIEQLEKKVEEFEIKWKSVCPTHKKAISICKECGKE